jgi:serine/threonine protein kinase
MFYEMLCGQFPFDSDGSFGMVMMGHISEVPTPLHEMNVEVPATVAELIMRMLAKKAENRPLAKEIAQELIKLYGNQIAGYQDTGTIEEMARLDTAERSLLESQQMRSEIDAAIKRTTDKNQVSQEITIVKNRHEITLIKNISDADPSSENVTLRKKLPDADSSSENATLIKKMPDGDSSSENATLIKKMPDGDSSSENATLIKKMPDGDSSSENVTLIKKISDGDSSSENVTLIKKKNE